MESGEDASASRRNSRLIMSSFSKRKVNRGPGLHWGRQGGGIPSGATFILVSFASYGWVQGPKIRSSGYCPPLAHTGHCLRFR